MITITSPKSCPIASLAMTTGILSVNSARLRNIYRPPRGTSSRILIIRLRRCASSFRPRSRLTRAAAEHDAVLNPRASRADQSHLHKRLTCRSITTTNYGGITSGEADFLSELVAQYGDFPSPASRKAQKQVEAHHEDGLSIQHLPDMGLRDAEAGRVDEDLAQELPNPFRRALQAVQQRDSRQLLIYLKQIVAMPYDEVISTVAILPKTTFSEFLRSLDPYEVGSENDPTDGARISVGMWQALNLHHVVDEWGVRYIYVRLLERMLMLVQALQKTGRVLNINDYTPLIRAAGAVSDFSCIKALWHQEKSTRPNSWLQSEVRNELVKSRMLVHPLYSSYDKMRVLVKPLDLHRTGRNRFSRRKVYALNQLRLRLRQKAYRFGLNRSRATAEDISRILRKRGPITRIFIALQRDGHPITEEFLCTTIVAFGRASALRFIEIRILEDFFGIFTRKIRRKLDQDRSASQDDHSLVQYLMQPAEAKRRRPRDPLRPLHPFVKPTERLLYAIIEAYCSNGQFEYATQLVNFISKQFSIPIPVGAWSELLKWAYICNESPNAVAWKKAGMTDRVSSKESVQIIWNIMTSAPYNVKPDFDHYNYLIRSLISRKQFLSALSNITIAKELYTRQCAEYESAVFEYIRALRSGINPTNALRQYQRTRFRKQRMWFLMSGWFRLLLTKKFRTERSDDEWATRLIPDIIKGYRDIMPNPVEYRTATGYVQLMDPAEDWPFKIPVGEDVITEVPMRSGAGQQRLERIRKPRWTMLGSHSLAEKKSAKLDPLPLLSDRWTSFAMAHPRHVFRWAKARKEERLVRQGMLVNDTEVDDIDD